MRDTSPSAQDRYFARLAELSPAERAACLVRLTRATLDLATAGIRQQVPGASPRVVAAYLADRRYGRAIATRYFSDVFPPS